MKMCEQRVFRLDVFDERFTFPGSGDLLGSVVFWGLGLRVYCPKVWVFGFKREFSGFSLRFRVKG
jgi:hypothetical protein